MQFLLLFEQALGQGHGRERIFPITIRADLVGPTLCDRSAAHNDLHAGTKTVPLQSLDDFLLARHRCGQQSGDADKVSVQFLGLEGKHSNGTSTPRSNTSNPFAESIVPTRVFPISWISPFTVPRTTFPSDSRVAPAF